MGTTGWKKSIGPKSRSRSAMSDLVASRFYYINTTFRDDFATDIITFSTSVVRTGLQHCSPPKCRREVC